MMIPNNKITLTDNFMDICVKLSDGNPGALTVLVQLYKEEALVDPDSAFAPFSTMLAFDSRGIYADKIWILYKDICKQNIVYLITLFRANQLGLISDEAIEDAIDSGHAGNARSIDIDIKDLLKQVQEKLPEFAKGIK
jgi:hypothetical protein